MCVWPLAAQESTITTTGVDINGNRVTQGPELTERKTPTGSEVIEKRQSINGRMVPQERVEDHVVREDASGRVVERVIQPYGPDGNPGPSTRETIEEQKGPDGSFTIRTSTYRGDINGNMQLVQRTVTQARKTDSSETSETVVEAPTINGSVETVEKRSTVKTMQPNGSYQAEDNTYRRNASGEFYTAVRQTTDHAVQGTEATDNTAQYEVGPNGEPHLHGQTVSKTITNADGSKNVVVDIYGQNVPGTVDGGGTQPLQLQEQQIIRQTPGPNHGTMQSVSVRRPTVSDPNSLGPEKQLSQTVCKGECKP